MPVPLHPLVVHFPMALAVIMPIVAAFGVWAAWKGKLRRAGWVGIVLGQSALVAAAVLAINTGQREEDRVEAAVPSAALHQHEEYAEQFAWASGAVLGLALIGFLPPRRALRAAAAATFVGTVAVAGLGFRVGHAGGQLVYTYGAASVYASGERAAQDTSGRITPVASVTAPADERRDDDEDDAGRR